MTKFVIFALVLVLAFTTARPSEASVCRQMGDRTICILSIQRSAKNYWEYRAAVSIDNKKRPVEVYNCRDRVRTQRKGKTIPFERNGAGELICGMFKQ